MVRVTRRSLFVGAGACLVGLAAVVRAGRARFRRATERRVGSLLSNARSRPARTYARDDLDGLPAPVRRYFETVLDGGQPLVETVRLTQRGVFRLGDASSPWKPLEATQHYTVDPPGFVWDASIRLFPGVSVRVVDAYEGGEGSLRAALLSTVTVAEAGPGPEMNESELQRYLAEAVWFPTALLPREGVEWEAVDDSSARATLDHAGNAASLVFHFDDRDLVSRVTAEERYREADDGYAPWTGSFDDYRRRDGMLVPVAAEVAWNLPDGDLPYWRARLPTVEYRPGTDRDRAGRRAGGTVR